MQGRAMKNIIKIMLLTLLMNTSVYANPLLVQGVSFPQGPISFADEVVEYRVGNGSKTPFDKPNAVIALPNGNVCKANKCPSFSLGKHGFITIKFNDNYLTTSGDSSDDLWIFEVGEVVESTAVEISKDGKQWISVGKVEGATSGVDIDAYKANGVIDDTKYYYVKLTDLKGESESPYQGADIDAVAAISAATSQVRKLVKEIEEKKFVDLEVNFEGNHWRLTQKAKGELDKLGEALSSYSLRQGKFELIGHIAGVNDAKTRCYKDKNDYRYGEKCHTYMQWGKVLSEGRANSVKKYLEENYPISSARLKASGVGNSDHKYPNDPWNAGNRRVEVKYIKN
jgi:outer membrane protein OmpA-like peptidoglycan-associated protein